MSGSTQLLIVASRPLGGGSEYSEASEGCSLETGSADFALFEVCGSSPRTNERLRKTAEFLRGQTLPYPRRCGLPMAPSLRSTSWVLAQGLAKAPSRSASTRPV